MDYFISDLHLGYFDRARDRKREQLFIDFLEAIRKDCGTLYLVGDIFDYWFEYRSVIPREFYAVLTALRDFKRDGNGVEYIMGNHDFGHVDFFETELGIVVNRGDVSTDINGRKFFIAHGDGKGKGDTGYKILKKILRNRLAQFLFRKLHPDFGIWLASGSSRASRKYTDNNKKWMSGILDKYASEKLSQGYDYVIMGHRHQAGIKVFETGQYVDLGSWLGRPTYACYDGEEMLLNYVDELLDVEPWTGGNNE